jgi:hypothetical protein
MKAKPIKYVKHPIDQEQKAKLIAEGYKIIDEVYKPAESENHKRATTKQTEIISVE